MAGNGTWSGADFEFYDESSNANFTDPDGKAPNLDKWYCYTATIYQFHSRGFNSMAIAKMKTTKEDWLQNNVYDATYLFVFGDFSKEMTKKGYLLCDSLARSCRGTKYYNSLIQNTQYSKLGFFVAVF